MTINIKRLVQFLGLCLFLAGGAHVLASCAPTNGGLCLSSATVTKTVEPDGKTTTTEVCNYGSCANDIKHAPPAQELSKE